MTFRKATAKDYTATSSSGKVTSHATVVNARCQAVKHLKADSDPKAVVKVHKNGSYVGTVKADEQRTGKYLWNTIIGDEMGNAIASKTYLLNIDGTLGRALVSIFL